MAEPSNDEELRAQFRAYQSLTGAERDRERIALRCATKHWMAEVVRHVLRVTGAEWAHHQVDGAAEGLLLEAVDKYDPDHERRASFRTYLHRWAFGKLMDWVKEETNWKDNGPRVQSLDSIQHSKAMDQEKRKQHRYDLGEEPDATDATEDADRPGHAESGSRRREQEEAFKALQDYLCELLDLRGDELQEYAKRSAFFVKRMRDVRKKLASIDVSLPPVKRPDCGVSTKPYGGLSVLASRAFGSRKAWSDLCVWVSALAGDEEIGEALSRMGEDAVDCWERRIIRIALLQRGESAAQ